MANREACEVYIEQEIKDSLAAGKKPWTIGKELSKWVEKLFEVTINPRTIEERARKVREKVTLNNVKESKPIEFICEICSEIFDVEVWHCENCDHHWQLHLKNCSNCHNPRFKTPLIIENRKPQGGGKREGAGRPKVVVEPVSDAWRYSQMAISQLDKIKAGDPNRVESLNQVIEYCENRKEKCE
jgi:hypothetical protein